jgi:hypothetical protein
MITTYPEMNAKIVGLLRVSDSPIMLYAALRIEELEEEVLQDSTAFNELNSTSKERIEELEQELRDAEWRMVGKK